MLHEKVSSEPTFFDMRDSCEGDLRAASFSPPCEVSPRRTSPDLRPRAIHRLGTVSIYESYIAQLNISSSTSHLMWTCLIAHL